MPIGQQATDFIVNLTASPDVGSSTITTLANGRFVVAWYSPDTGDGSGTCVRARVFNADGSAAGDDFIVNSTAANDQHAPAITALADGRFIATWPSYDTGDGSGSCIRARVFNADGSPAGSDFLVNSTAANDQYNPTITALADGRFVATWMSDDPGDGEGTCIRARVFDPTVFHGTAAEDSWKGGNLADTISGGAGADHLWGLDGDDLINGDDGDDWLYGDDGNDTLDGGTGADKMYGGKGDDTFIVDDVGDKAYETSNQGIDTVQASVSYNLAGQHIEKLTLTGKANIDGTGNSFANTLTGNDGNNILNGGTGLDTLSGGAGADTFHFGDTLNGTTNVDTIKDFSSIDLISLSAAIFTKAGPVGALAADAFVANTSGAAADASDRIIYETDTGILRYDPDGTGAAAAIAFAKIDGLFAMNAADFVVV
jgi:Ca2+-binding RTX toxin-like protein